MQTGRQASKKMDKLEGVQIGKHEDRQTDKRDKKIYADRQTLKQTTLSILDSILIMFGMQPVSQANIRL